ncbi:MAG: tyrosine-type recombinase/integrase [Pleurocapsa minor HA4230-MV1]|jgi:integrase|nr:tyrosine-type recombinase/integrase [Pleurocapsa minor HA4230-MV1]
MLSIKALQERIAKSELGKEWINNPLLNKDVWSVEELGYSEEESKIKTIRNIYFQKFSLSWLKLLTKLTVLSIVREKIGLDTVKRRVNYLKQFDSFLLEEGIIQPELISGSLIEKFITIDSQQERQSTITYVSKLWAEEQWLKLPYTPRKYKTKTPSIKAIPEEVLHQIYEKFDLFPPPLERLLRLQLVLGCRIGEMLRMPRRCLKTEGEQWFLLRWIEKRKHWRFYQVHPAVAELIREQQKFLDKELGSNSEFDKLFGKISIASHDGVKGINKTGTNRFDVKPVYLPSVLTYTSIHCWLQDFREIADLKDKHNNRFELTSHMFRRTKASVMAYCEAEDEYIAAVLGHGSLDMLPHYRKRSLERLEKEANAKGYVDKYGRLTSFKPRKRRYERLAELLKVSTLLGECHRPTMLGDCQYRYSCLSCDHHRVTLENKPELEADVESLQKDLTQAQTVGQERRVTEINRLLKLLKDRLEGLRKLEQLQGDNHV